MSYYSGLSGAKKALPIAVGSKKITKGFTRPLAPNEIDTSKFINSADYQGGENEETKTMDLPSSSTGKIPVYMYKQLIKEGKYTPKPKKPRRIFEASKLLSFGHLMPMPEGHASHRKYSVQINYLDNKGKSSKRTVYFGLPDRIYFAEKGSNATHEDEVQRSREVNRLGNDQNPLYPNFWVNNVLNRKGVNSPFEGFMQTCLEHIV